VKTAVTCHGAQERMSTLLAGGVGPRERADIEAHATRCARCGAALRDMVAMSVALDRAYAPLRARSAALSPARVRLAMRLVQPVPAATRFSRITARLTEFGLAAAVTAFAFVGSASVAPQHTIVDEAAAPDAITATHVTAGSDDQYVFRWLRLGRYAPPPGDVLDPAVSPKVYDDEPMQPVTHERSGLLR
jgi:anti-sigma factor RsiW